MGRGGVGIGEGRVEMRRDGGNAVEWGLEREGWK